MLKLHKLAGVYRANLRKIISGLLSYYFSYVNSSTLPSVNRELSSLSLLTSRAPNSAGTKKLSNSLAVSLELRTLIGIYVLILSLWLTVLPPYLLPKLASSRE